MCDKLVYNHDLTATLLAMSGVEPEQKMDGINIWPAVTPNDWKPRDHVTVAWGPLVTVIDETYWYNATYDGQEAFLYSYREDPYLERNIVKEFPAVCEKMLDYVREDAGGEIPKAFEDFRKLPGCTPYNI